MAIKMSIEPKLHITIPEDLIMFSFEGIDGSGKSTQVNRVAEALTTNGLEAVILTSPSDRLIGKFIKANLKALHPWERSALFLMDQIATLRKYEGKNSVLLWDRYKDSDIVSNKDHTPEESALWVACLPNPLRTFLLDINPLTIAQKRQESAHDHSNDLEWQRLKYERYHTLAQQNAARFRVINADRNMEDITKEIVAQIMEDIKRFQR